MRKFMPSIKGDQTGFTLLEMLIALGVISSCVVLFSSMMHILTELGREDFYEEDMIGLTQLRYLLSQSKEVAIEEQSLHFQYRKENFYLHHSGTHLILSPGTQIMLQQIDHVYFQEENDCIIMHVERGETEYDGLLWCR